MLVQQQQQQHVQRKPCFGVGTTPMSTNRAQGKQSLTKHADAGELRHQRVECFGRAAAPRQLRLGKPMGQAGFTGTLR